MGKQVFFKKIADCLIHGRMLIKHHVLYMQIRPRLFRHSKIIHALLPRRKNPLAAIRFNSAS